MVSVMEKQKAEGCKNLKNRFDSVVFLLFISHISTEHGDLMQFSVKLHGCICAYQTSMVEFSCNNS